MNEPQTIRNTDEYIEQVRYHLLGLPKSEQEDALLEMRQHIEALILQKQTAGLAENEAVTKALEKFGDPGTVGRRLVSNYMLQQTCGAGARKSPTQKARGYFYWLICFVLIGAISSATDFLIHAMHLGQTLYPCLSFGILGAILGLFLGLRKEPEMDYYLPGISIADRQELALRRAEEFDERVQNYAASGIWWQQVLSWLLQPSVSNIREPTGHPLAYNRKSPARLALYSAGWLLWFGLLWIIPQWHRPGSYLVWWTAFFFSMTVFQIMAEGVARVAKRWQNSRRRLASR